MKPCVRHYRNGKPCTAGVRRDFARAPFPAPQTCTRHMTAGDVTVLGVLGTYRPHGPAIPACMRWGAPEELGSQRALIRWQADRCAICGFTQGRLLLDHCHDSGLIRGYLCGSCNSAEGHDNDPTGILDAYRYNPPAVIVGWTAAYRGFASSPEDPAPGVVKHLGPAPRDPALAITYLRATYELGLTQAELLDVTPEAIAELTSLLAPGNAQR